MPDWTYHPFFKPLLFRLPAEDARRVTIGLLALQAKTRIGRRIFRAFGHGIPPAELAITAFGVRFPAPVGIAPGIDVDAASLGVLQYLGVGYVAAGPAGATARARTFDQDPIRVREALAIARSARGPCSSATEVARRVATSPALEVPIGIAVDGDDLADAAREASAAAAFVILPAAAGQDEATLRAVRAASKKPLVLRLSASWDDATLDAVVARALTAGIDAVVAVSGASTELLADGELTGPFLRARRLEVIARLRAAHGAALPIVAAGGVMTPDDALEALDAGATLVELDEGLVYGGPALPGRILHRLEARARGGAHVTSPPRAITPAPEAYAAFRAWGSLLVAFTGLVLILSGLAALALASTVVFFPYDFQFLGMTAEDLCRQNACRIVHFMQHDRVSFGGSIVSIGVVYVWLARVPLRRGEPWAFWTLLTSGLVGFASFLLYLGYGYLDVWHGRATLALIPFFVGGLVLSFAGLSRPRGLRELFRQGAPAYLWSPAGMGRACLMFAAVGMILGGVLIMLVGVTRVFVPTDLAYLGATRAELEAISPRLVPLVAHDRSGFGGGLFSGGIAILATVWCGARPGERGLWWALVASGAIGFGCAIGVHPIVGYTSFEHLVPAYLGALAFAIGMAWLFTPMCRASKGPRFPDVG